MNVKIKQLLKYQIEVACVINIKTCKPEITYFSLEGGEGGWQKQPYITFTAHNYKFTNTGVTATVKLQQVIKTLSDKFVLPFVYIYLSNSPVLHIYSAKF